MDTDEEILKLIESRWMTSTEITNVLKINPRTVRKRIQRLRTLGFIEGRKRIASEPKDGIVPFQYKKQKINET